MTVAFNTWLRQFDFILELAWLEKIPPTTLTDTSKGQRRLVSIDISGGGRIWIINNAGMLSELRNIGKPVKGKVTVEVAEDEEIFLAKSLADATKKVHAMMR